VRPLLIRSLSFLLLLSLSLSPAGVGTSEVTRESEESFFHFGRGAWFLQQMRLASSALRRRINGPPPGAPPSGDDDLDVPHYSEGFRGLISRVELIALYFDVRLKEEATRRGLTAEKDAVAFDRLRGEVAEYAVKKAIVSVKKGARAAAAAKKQKQSQ
jgi:hypothetical protein